MPGTNEGAITPDDLVVHSDEQRIRAIGIACETVTVTHWRAVSDKDGGSIFSMSTREERPGWRAEDRAREWATKYPGYHLERWEQTYVVTESEWSRVDA